MRQKTKPFNAKHERLIQRARNAAPGERARRRRDLVLWVARQMCPRLWPSSRKAPS